MPTLAYTPFLDPLPVVMHDWWWTLLFPIAFLVAFAYKAVRVGDQDLALPRFLRRVAAMTLQIIAGMLALAAALYAFVELLAPLYS